MLAPPPGGLTPPPTGNHASTPVNVPFFVLVVWKDSFFSDSEGITGIFLHRSVVSELKFEVVEDC